MAVGTGHGTQLGFGSTGAKWAPKYTSIGAYGYERETLDRSHLQSDGMREYREGDLFAITPFSAVFWWEPNLNDSEDEFELLLENGKAAPAEPTTLTLPDGTTYAANAFVAGLEYGELTTDVLTSGTITTQWAEKPAKTVAPAP